MPENTLALKKRARGSATRTANKLRRKETILDCARKIIATQGYDALTLSQLAEDAGVTIPTIHNLLGKKSQIIEHLVGDVVTRLEEVLSRKAEDDPIRAVQVFTDEIVSLYRQDEALYKAAFVAGERLNLFEHHAPQGIFMRSLGLAEQVCRTARDNGFLAGDIATDILAQHLFGAQRLARQDWVNNYIDLDGYRFRVLSGMLTVLGADATPEFKARLIAELRALGTPAGGIG